MSKIDNSTDKINVGCSSTPRIGAEKVITSKNAMKVDNSTTSEGYVHMSTVKT